MRLKGGSEYRLTLLGVGVAVALGLVVVSVAAGAFVGADGNYKACVATKSGAVRIVDQSASCARPKETEIALADGTSFYTKAASDARYAGASALSSTESRVSALEAQVATLTNSVAELSFSCAGETYDVNNNRLDGCERTQTRTGHTADNAFSLGTATDCDDSAQPFSDSLYSDSRQHTNPFVTGFDPSVGSAPAFYAVHATDVTFCSKDVIATITTSGGSSVGTCYRLTITTDVGLPAVLNVSGSGTSTTPSPGTYTDGSNIVFKVEKTCDLPIQEAISYTVTYHL